MRRILQTASSIFPNGGKWSILLSMRKNERIKQNTKGENWQKFRQGFGDGVPIGLGYAAVGFGIGLSCRAASLTPFQGLLLSLLNNASAGEYGGITVMAEDAGYFTMVLMMLVVNARYMLMSCALSQKLSPDTPLRDRLIIGFDLTDELFGIAIHQPGYLNPRYYFGAMCAAMPCWSLGTLLGVIVGQLLPVWALSGLSVLLFGMFIAIIVPAGKQDKVVLWCILVSFALGYLALRIPWLKDMSEGMRTLLLTVIISAVAAVLFPRKDMENGAKEGETR